MEFKIPCNVTYFYLAGLNVSVAYWFQKTDLHFLLCSLLTLISMPFLLSELID